MPSAASLLPDLIIGARAALEKLDLMDRCPRTGLAGAILPLWLNVLVKKKNLRKERVFHAPFSFFLSELQVAGGGFTRAPVGLDLEGYFLTFSQAAQTGPLKRADMDENILAAVIGLNEAVALLTIVPFHDAHAHGDSPFASYAHCYDTRHAAAIFEFWG
jgi:hypothetical protein